MTTEAMEHRQALTFELCGETYAVPLLHVQEVVELEPVTRIPATPPYLLGVVSLRGQVIPVIDLAIKLGFGATTIGPRSCIVFFEVEQGEELVMVGLLVETVNEVVSLDAVPEASTDGDTFESCWRELDLGGGSTLRVLDIDRAMRSGDAAEADALVRDYNGTLLGRLEQDGGAAGPEGQ